MPLKPVFRLSFSRYEFFWRKNFKALFSTPFPIEKAVFIFVVQRPVPLKVVMASNIYFSQLFWKILFLSKKLLNEEIQNLISYKEGYINFCRKTLPFPKK